MGADCRDPCVRFLRLDAAIDAAEENPQPVESGFWAVDAGDRATVRARKPSGQV